MENKYQLYQGDCLSFMRGMDAGSVDAVITDPPYGLGMRTVSGGTLKNTQTQFIEDMKEDEWDNSVPEKETFDAIRNIGKRQIIWGGNYFELPPTRCVLVWDKMTYIPTMSRVEIAWTSMDSPAKYIMINSNLSDRVHPTQKPIELMKWCVELCSKPNDVIFDPYMGSGTTGVACMQMGRRFIGIERKQKYFAIAEKRIKAAASQEIMF